MSASTYLAFLAVTIGLANAGLFDTFETMDVEDIMGAKGMFGGLKLNVPKGMGGMGAAATSQFASALSVPGVTDRAYEKFNAAFNPDTKDDHSSARKNTFKSKIQSIFEHNVKSKYGEHGATYTKGINQFSAMTTSEVVAKYTNGGRQITEGSFGRSSSSTPPNKIPAIGRKRAAPNARDWRQSGVVTPVKNQGGCGSCTFFACTAVIEANMDLMKGVKGLDLSEQYLLDCANGTGIYGCGGNWPGDVYKWIKDNGGECGESEYPYKATAGTCRSCKKQGFVGNYWALKSGDEQQLKDWVGDYGVHSVVITVQDGFQDYRGGIMNKPCDRQSYDHSVTVVGYGTENGQDYWIVKNSWGPNWGEKGYIRMARNKNNMCMIASMAYLAQP